MYRKPAHKSTWDVKEYKKKFSDLPSVFYMFFKLIKLSSASSSHEVEQLILLKYCQWYTDNLEYNINEI